MLQANRDWRLGVRIPSKPRLKKFGENLNVFRENRRNLDVVYDMISGQKKDYEAEKFSEVIIATADLCEECFGVTQAEVRKECTFSNLAHREVCSMPVDTN